MELLGSWREIAVRLLWHRCGIAVGLMCDRCGIAWELP